MSNREGANLESHTRARAADRRSRGARGSRTTLDYYRGLEENGAGPSDGRGGERYICNHTYRQARWAFGAWRSAGDGIIITHAYAAGR